MLEDSQIDQLNQGYVCPADAGPALHTDAGTLDCLPEVKGIGNYEEVFSRSSSHRTSYGEFHMLDLDALITAKEAMGRQKDIAAAKHLRAIKEKKQRT